MESIPGLPRLGSSSTPREQSFSETGLPPSLDHSGCSRPGHPSAGPPQRRWQRPGRRDILGEKERKDWRFQGTRRLVSFGIKGGGAVPPLTHHQPPLILLSTVAPNGNSSCRCSQIPEECTGTHTEDGYLHVYLHMPRYTHIHAHDQHTGHPTAYKESRASSQTQAVKPKTLVLWQVGPSSPRESPQQLVPALGEGGKQVYRLQNKSVSCPAGERGGGRERGPPGEPQFLLRAPSLFLHACFTFREAHPQPTLQVRHRQPDLYIITAGRALGAQGDKRPHITAEVTSK